MKRRTPAVIAVLAALAACVTTPDKPEPAPLPKDAAQITTEKLQEIVAPPPPPHVPVPYRPLVTPAPLTVVSLPVPNKPIVSFRLVFRTGSVDDPAGKEGLTALTTRVLVEGGTKALSASELLDALFPMAAELDADTDKELTVIAGRVHKDKLDRFLAIFTDVLLNPRLDPKEHERLRGEQLNAIKTRLRGENDEELGKVALDELLYKGHPYRHYTGGTVKGLEATTLEDVKAHWQRVFSQDRLVIGLAGAVDAALEKKVKDAFAKLPATGAARPVLPAGPGVRGHTVIVQRETASTAGSFGFTWDLRREDPDYPAVALAMSYFGEHRQEHGVLFQEVRDKRGLNYGTYAYAEHYRQEGWSSTPRTNVARSTQEMTIWLRPVEAKHGVFATRVVLDSLQGLLERPIPAEKWETARGFLAGATRIWAQTDQRRLGYAIDDLLYGTKDGLERLREATRTVTAEQAQAALKRRLSAGALNFAFVTKEAKGLQDALASQAPTPITYPSPKPAEVLEHDKAIAVQPLPMHAGSIVIRDAATFMEE